MTKKIKVGIDIRDLRIARTGARTYLEELCLEFKKEDPDFIFVFIDTVIPVYTGRNRILKLTEQARFLLWKQLVLPVKAWLLKCDIVFCTDYFVPCWKPGFLTIPVFHDAFLWEYPDHYNKYWLRSFYLLGVTAARRSPFVITSSQYSKERIAAFSGIAPEKIIPVYEAPKRLATALETGTTELNGDISTLLAGNYILHVGTFEKRKNLPVFINAFEKLVNGEHPDLTLVLIGQASPKKNMDDSVALRELIQDKKLQGHVFMPGYVSNEILDLFYKNAKLYVFPSINEGFGIPVLEAFSYGLPVIIADNSCLPEIAGDAAVSFDPANADELFHTMKLLLENNGLRQEMVARMNIRTRFFSWEKTAAQLKQVFQTATDQQLKSGEKQGR